VVLGHSLGGSYALLFAARFPRRTAGLVLVDHCPGAVHPATISIHATPKIYPTIAAALADTSRDKSAPPGSVGWARLEAVFKPVGGGYVFRRDPDYGNRVPLDPPNWTPKFQPTDTWGELSEVRAPVPVLRGAKSDRYTSDALARMRSEFPNAGIADIDAGHDIAGAAPEALIETVAKFLATRIDAEKAA
jgi:pimeloyl-ACP methyl ester carboxylesterase